MVTLITRHIKTTSLILLVLTFGSCAKEDPARHLNLGNWYLQRGLLDEAIMEYREVSRLNYNSPKDNIKKSDFLFLENVMNYDEITMSNPEQGEFQLKRIVLSDELNKKIAKAKKESEKEDKEVAIEDVVANAHLNLAIAYGKKGWLEEALREAKKSCEINPTDECKEQITIFEKEFSEQKENNPNIEGSINLDDTVCISTRFGIIKIELFPNLAPMHVENFLTHIKNGYYDGTIFHRIIPGFMIQGGDPNTKGDNNISFGTGGHAAKYFGIGNQNSNATWNVPAEFSDMKHKRGVLSMARANDPNSAGSQFYICVADAPHLDEKYSIFGKVIDGLNVVDEIVNLRRDKRDNPLERVEITIEVCR